MDQGFFWVKFYNSQLILGQRLRVGGYWKARSKACFFAKFLNLLILIQKRKPTKLFGQVLTPSPFIGKGTCSKTIRLLSPARARRSTEIISCSAPNCVAQLDAKPRPGSNATNLQARYDTGIQTPSCVAN